MTAVKEKIIRKKTSRIWEMDFLRGVCILLMVFDHAMFDFMYVPYWVTNYRAVEPGFVDKMSVFADEYWRSSIRRAVREFVVYTFIVLSGISCALSRSNIKRLIKLAAAALVLTLVTGIVDEIADMGVFILFGILHTIALSLLIYILLGKIWDNKYLFLVVGLALIIIGLSIDYINKPYFSEGIRITDPKLSSFSFKGLMQLIIGISDYGADSYGIVPYTGVFLAGAFFGRVLYADKHSLVPYLNGVWQKPVSFVGRNTIWVYLLHQPVVLGIILLICRSAGYTF